MANLRFRRVMRSDEIQKHFRLFRIMWERGVVGDGRGYSVKLAVGLRPRVFEFIRENNADTLMTIAGLRVHYSRSYGGIFG
jgi:hypothetical protein